MQGRLGFFDVQDRYAQLSRPGERLEKVTRPRDVEPFRYRLVKALKRCEGSKGGRPPDDPVLLFKVLILQSRYMCG